MADIFQAAGRFGQLTQAIEWALAAAALVGFLVLAGLIVQASGTIRRRIHTRRNIRRLESYANHPANRPRKEKP